MAPCGFKRNAEILEKRTGSEVKFLQFSATTSVKVKIACAKKSNQPDGNQIYGDDEVKHPGHNQNENPGQQRYYGSQPQSDVHKLSFREIVGPLGKGELVRILHIKLCRHLYGDNA